MSKTIHYEVRVPAHFYESSCTQGIHKTDSLEEAKIWKTRINETFDYYSFSQNSTHFKDKIAESVVEKVLDNEGCFTGHASIYKVTIEQELID